MCMSSSFEERVVAFAEKNICIGFYHWEFWGK